MGRMGRRHHRTSSSPLKERPMSQLNDLSRSLVPFVQGHTLVAVVELSLSSWLVAGVVPGLVRQPLKKLGPDEAELLRLLQRWRDEARSNGHAIERIVVAYEAGRDGFWLARWLTCTWDRSARHPFHQCCRLAGASTGEDRPARHRHVAACVHWLAARRARTLWNGRHPND